MLYKNAERFCFSPVTMTTLSFKDCMSDVSSYRRNLRQLCWPVTGALSEFTRRGVVGSSVQSIVVVVSTYRRNYDLWWPHTPSAFNNALAKENKVVLILEGCKIYDESTM